MKRDATPEEYEALNAGAASDPLGEDYQEFLTRITDLWWGGYERTNTDRIVPLGQPNSPCDLRFVLITNTEEIEFQCWCIDPAPRAAHFAQFEALYHTAEGNTVASLEPKMNREKDGGSPSDPPPPEKTPESTVAIGKVKKAKKKTKRRKSDLFDPLEGLLH